MKRRRRGFHVHKRPEVPRVKVETSTLGEAHRLAEELKAAGLIVSGCSLCSRLVLKKGRAPAPCPVCGALVTARKGK